MIPVSTNPAFAARPFNSAIEYGLRILFLLEAASEKGADVQRLVAYDYLLVHSGDVDGGPSSLHPAVPFRGTELLVKRDLINAGLAQLLARELLEKKFDATGIAFRSTNLTTAFSKLLKSAYACALRDRSKWVVERFGEMTDTELLDFMAANVGRWGAEFDRHTALNNLEL